MIQICDQPNDGRLATIWVDIPRKNFAVTRRGKTLHETTIEGTRSMKQFLKELIYTNMRFWESNVHVKKKMMNRVKNRKTEWIKREVEKQNLTMIRQVLLQTNNHHLHHPPKLGNLNLRLRTRLSPGSL